MHDSIADFSAIMWKNPQFSSLGVRGILQHKLPRNNGLSLS
jgi:hypothetical protein